MDRSGAFSRRERLQILQGSLSSSNRYGTSLIFLTELGINGAKTESMSHAPVSSQTALPEIVVVLGGKFTGG